MTGFGRGEASDGIRNATAEIKAVNHRYSEFSIKLPRRFSFAEDSVKQAVRSHVARGKVEITLSMLSTAPEESAVNINMEAARQYIEALKVMEEELGLNVPSDQMALYLMAEHPDILKTTSDEIDEEAITSVLNEAAHNAAMDLNRMREIEGEKLAADMMDRVDIITELLLGIEKKAPELAGIYQDKLNGRVESLLAKGGYSSSDLVDRIAVEVAMFADKSNITEEIVRQKSHLDQLKQILGGGTEAVGKKLDFLVQEMNREANTIGSKSNDLKITDLMLEMKSEIEKIREQVQNIE